MRPSPSQALLAAPLSPQDPKASECACSQSSGYQQQLSTADVAKRCGSGEALNGFQADNSGINVHACIKSATVVNL